MQGKQQHLQSRSTSILPSFLLLTPLTCPKQSFPCKILLPEFGRDQRNKNWVWSSPAGLTHLEDYNLAPLHLFIFHLISVNQCVSLSCRLRYSSWHSSVLQVGVIAEALSGAWAHLAVRYGTSKAHLPDLPKKHWWTNTEQRRKRGHLLPLPFIGDIRRNDPLSWGKDGNAWNPPFIAKKVASETVSTVLSEGSPSWPRRCEVGWIHLLPPTSSRQSGGEIKFTLWLLWKCVTLRCP